MTSELHTPSTLADLIEKELMGVDPDSQCVELDDADWKLIVAALRRCSPPADTLAGLVRIEVISPNVPNGCGEYVLYSEAAVVVAAKDAEIEKLKDGGHESFKSAVGWQERAKAAEAELQQLKAQEPAGYVEEIMYQSDNGRVEMSVYDVGEFKTPLYASPVSDSLKAENERLREALEFYADGINNRIARAALNVEASNDQG